MAQESIFDSKHTTNVHLCCSKVLPFLVLLEECSPKPSLEVQADATAPPTNAFKAGWVDGCSPPPHPIHPN